MNKVDELIRRRKSVRSYDVRPLSSQDQQMLIRWMQENDPVPTPFTAQIAFHLLRAKDYDENAKLGTYGVIRNAPAFIGITAENTPTAMETIGYRFEKIVLEATALRLGTCWLAGTFNREQFSDRISMGKDDIFPIVCPVGYPAEKRSLTEKVFRTFGKADQRKEWKDIFFSGSFGVPLMPAEAGEYATPLEMLRLAPSAANRQPWRIVYQGHAFHFYREENPKSKYGYDLQRLDVGIAACHFHLSAQAHSLKGAFQYAEPQIDSPANMLYLFSWIPA